MIGRAYNPQMTDSLLVDLEGWCDVLRDLAQSTDDVRPSGIRVIGNAISELVVDLRAATDTGSDTTEAQR